MILRAAQSRRVGPGIVRSGREVLHERAAPGRAGGQNGDVAAAKAEDLQEQAGGKVREVDGVDERDCSPLHYCYFMADLGCHVIDEAEGFPAFCRTLTVQQASKAV